MIGKSEDFFFPSGVWVRVNGGVGIAGAGGGLVASIATCPLDVVKTKLQAQRAVQGQVGYQGTLGMFGRSSFTLVASERVNLTFGSSWFI